MVFRFSFLFDGISFLFISGIDKCVKQALFLVLYTNIQNCVYVYVEAYVF